MRLVQAARDESNDDEEDEPSKQDDGLPKALKPGSLLRRLGGGTTARRVCPSLQPICLPGVCDDTFCGRASRVHALRGADCTQGRVERRTAKGRLLGPRLSRHRATLHSGCWATGLLQGQQARVCQERRDAVFRGAIGSIDVYDHSLRSVPHAHQHRLL